MDTVPAPAPTPIARICWKGPTGFTFRERWMPRAAAEIWLPYLVNNCPNVEHWIEDQPGE